MEIKVGKTEFGLPKIEWVQSDVIYMKDIISEYHGVITKKLFIYNSISVVSFFSLALFLHVIIGYINPIIWFIMLLETLYIFRYVLHKYDVNRDYPYPGVPGRGVHVWRVKSFRAVLMLGNSPEQNFAFTLLSAPSSETMKNMPAGIYYAIPANELKSFSLNTMHGWFGSEDPRSRDVPNSHLVMAECNDGDVVPVAYHYGALSEVIQLRRMMEQVFIEQRPPQGWGKEMARTADDDDPV